MNKRPSAISRFFEGLFSYAAILPSFYTSYPYFSADRLLTIDWYNVRDDMGHAIYKYEKERKK
jgi:hypothetical protein